MQDKIQQDLKYPKKSIGLANYEKYGYSSDQVGGVNKFCCGILLYGALRENIRRLKKKE
jgi:hypothetical protein